MIRFITFQVGFFLTPEYHTIVVVDEKEDHVETFNKIKTSKTHGQNSAITARKSARTSLPNRVEKEC
jgi:hypothetical protein